MAMVTMLSAMAMVTLESPMAMVTMLSPMAMVTMLSPMASLLVAGCLSDRNRALSCEPGREGEAVSELLTEPSNISVTFRSISEL